MARKYALVRGCLTLGNFNASGQKIGGVNLHMTTMELMTADTYAEHKNTCAAVAKMDARALVDRVVTAKVSIDELKKEVTALAIGGTASNVASGRTFSAVLLPTGLVVGDVVPIPSGYKNLASLTMVDSTGSPVTLVVGTHYTVDLKAGLITIVSVSGLTQPLKASGSETSDYDKIVIGDASQVFKWARFSGINVSNNNLPVIWDIERLSFDPSTVKIKEPGNDFSAVDFDATLIDFDNTGYGEVFYANA